MSEAITSWRAAAAVLGVSYDTLWRRRKKRGDTMETPWWASADEVRTWWRALIAPLPAARRAPKKPASKVRTLERPLDARAKIRQLTGR